MIMKTGLFALYVGIITGMVMTTVFLFTGGQICSEHSCIKDVKVTDKK